MPTITGAILGTWYIANPGGGTDQIAFSFLDDGTFLVADKGTVSRDPTGTSGIEWGTYTWNEATGAFSYVTTVDTDGQWGLSHAGIRTIRVTGDTLIMNGTDTGGDFSVPRLTSPANSIVGSWYSRQTDGGTDQIVVNFLANGTVLIADKGTVARDPNGTSGIEWGTYTWNAATGALGLSLSINTDGQWGFSHANATVAQVSGATLSVGGATFTRLSPLQATTATGTTGTAGADTLAGTAANDTLRGFGGNDSLDGGAGIDTAVYAGTRASYTVTQTATGFTVTDNSGAEGTDTLVNVERLQFADTRLALDIGSNAGTTAKVLGAVFGPSSITNKAFVGIGLSLMDGGMSFASLMDLAITFRLGASASNAAVVDLLYTNVVGTAPSDAARASYVALLDSGALTRANLGVIAADSGLNQSHIGLVGLASTGIEYQ